MGTINAPANVSKETSNLLEITKSPILYKLLRRLTTEIRFIYESEKKIKLKNKIGSEETYMARSASVEEAYETLTELGGKNLKPIVFGCETTTVSFLLELINERFGKKPFLKQAALERSHMFHIPRSKKPSSYSTEHIRNNDFDILTKENVKKSKKRFRKFSNDVNRIEHEHLQSIRRIFLAVDPKFY